MIDRKYFPSKNFLTALSIAVAVIVIAIIFVYWKPSVTQYNNNLVADTSASSSAMNIDSDNDGLPDWKEALYGTDPHNPDTDGDGTPDGQEVAEGRDPLKANTAPAGQEPNDKIDPATIAENQKEIESYEKLNDIDKFSRDLVSNVAAAQPASGSMGQDAMNYILTQALSELPQKNYSGVTKTTDLNLQKTDNSNLNKNMTAYEKNFSIEMAKLVPLLGTDIDLMNSYISNGGTSTKSDILELTDKYQAIVNDFIKMPVPITVYYDINYHLKIINDLEIIIAIDRDVANSDKDSLGIFSDISAYTSAEKDLFSTIGSIGDVLK